MEKMALKVKHPRNRNRGGKTVKVFGLRSLQSSENKQNKDRV